MSQVTSFIHYYQPLKAKNMKPEHFLEKRKHPSAINGLKEFASISFERMKGVYLSTHPPIQTCHPSPVVLGSKLPFVPCVRG